MNFSDYQNQASSEKLVLATLDASKRLMGWTVHSGSVYKLTGVAFPVIVSLEDSGTAYTEATSIETVTASKYFLDRDTQTLYIRTTGSDNPNGRFLVATFRFFFANAPVVLPWDLATGFEVPWEPLISSTSQFGVEIDTINQATEAIEGSGQLKLVNDQDFWPKSFDKLIFENKAMMIYSYHRDLDPSEAKLLFRGTVERRSYSSDAITFSLRDMLAELKNPVPLSTIGSLGQRSSPSVNLAYQRMIFGRVFGFRPTNLDEVNAGYPITGTIGATVGSPTLTGSGTAFLTQLSPDDQLDIQGTKYTIASVASDTSLTLTENFSATSNVSGVSPLLIPDQPKRWINRVWKIAGHALREPVTTTVLGSTVTELRVTSTADFFPGDVIYVGTLGAGERAIVEKVVNSSLLKLATSLIAAPGDGVQIRRPAVQNVRINDVLLAYEQDYTLDATTATLTLKSTAEANAAPIRQLAGSVTFNSNSRVITATGLDAILRPGDLVGLTTQAAYYEVLAVTDTGATLRTPYMGATTTGAARYKNLIFDNDAVLTCDVLGRTEDGTSSGTFIRNGPRMVRTLLSDLGLSGLIDTASFTAAEGYMGQDMGLVIPEKFNDSKQTTYRQIINTINRSIFGSLVQTEAFKLSYIGLRPNKNNAALRLSESDILSFSHEASSQNLVKTSTVQYQPKEYDYLTLKDSIRTKQKSSDTSTYILKTDIEKVIATKLVNESDAEMYASRWALILESSSGSIKLRTKLQGALLEVGDVIDIEHRKLFERLGGSDKRRIVLVERVTKDGSAVNIEAVDLSNTFNRAASIHDSTANYSSATQDERLYGGYITDTYGLIDNDPETAGLNIIF